MRCLRADQLPKYYACVLASANPATVPLDAGPATYKGLQGRPVEGAQPALQDGGNGQPCELFDDDVPVVDMLPRRVSVPAIARRPRRDRKRQRPEEADGWHALVWPAPPPPDAALAIQDRAPMPMPLQAERPADGLPEPRADTGVGVRSWSIAPKGGRTAVCYVCDARISVGAYRIDYRFKASSSLRDQRRVHFECAARLPLTAEDSGRVASWLAAIDLAPPDAAALAQLRDSLADV